MTKLEIRTHGGDVDQIEVDAYNAAETVEIINGITKNETGNPHNVILMGDNIYSCIDIKSIKVVPEEIIEEPNEEITEEETDRSAE